ncbi:MAG: hypothetical protein HY275_02695 [Gemmatimonadetes bacterium]|nr:hypothetical protein [Gemmatimonadota bacterium]
MHETPKSPRANGRRGDQARETLFQRIDAIVGSIRPAPQPETAPRAQALPPVPPVPPALAGASMVGANLAHAAATHVDADPVFGRLLERWFALERDRVLGEHLHLDQVRAVASSYAGGETELRVVR